MALICTGICTILGRIEREASLDAGRLRVSGRLSTRRQSKLNSKSRAALPTGGVDRMTLRETSLKSRHEIHDAIGTHGRVDRQSGRLARGWRSPVSARLSSKPIPISSRNGNGWEARFGAATATWWSAMPIMAFRRKRPGVRETRAEPRATGSRGIRSPRLPGNDARRGLSCCQAEGRCRAVGASPYRRQRRIAKGR